MLQIEIAPGNILQDMYRRNLERSAQLKEAMASIVHDEVQNKKPRDYNKLLIMVRNHLEARRLKWKRESMENHGFYSVPGIFSRDHSCDVQMQILS